MIHFSAEGFLPHTCVSVCLFPACQPAHDNFMNFSADKTVDEQLPLGKLQIRLIHRRGSACRLLVDSSWAAVGFPSTKRLDLSNHHTCINLGFHFFPFHLIFSLLFVVFLVFVCIINLFLINRLLKATEARG